MFPALQRTAWIPCALGTACACKGNVTAPRAGAGSTVRLRCPCARSSAQAMAPSCWTQDSAAVSHSGQDQTAPQVWWDLAVSALPVLSAGGMKESCCCCADGNLKNKIGMNRGYCGMALHGLSAAGFQLPRVRNVFSLWQKWWDDTESSSPARGQMPPGMHWGQMWLSPELLSTCQAHAIRESTVPREIGKMF